MATKTRAAERARARLAIGRVLERLDPEDRYIVLEDLLYEAEQAARRAQSRRPPRTGHGAKGERPENTIDEDQDQDEVDQESGEPTPAEAPAVVERSEDVPLWQRIKDYCREHPSKDGVFSIADLPKDLVPGTPGWRVRTTLYIAIKRKSPNSDRGPVRNPEFEMVGEGRFRLLGEAPKANPMGPSQKRRGRASLERAPEEDSDEVR